MEFDLLLAQLYDELQSGEHVDMDKYIGLALTWRAKLQAHHTRQKRHPGALLEFIEPYPDGGWDEEVVTADWLREVIEETEQGGLPMARYERMKKIGERRWEKMKAEKGKSKKRK
jgi:hypothetical protein